MIGSMKYRHMGQDRIGANKRCQVHLMRNILGSSSPRIRVEVAQGAKLVLQAADMNEARRRLNEFVERFQKSAPRAVECLENGIHGAYF